MNTLFFKKNIQGFTLVELLVVLGLFSGIATLALGSLLNVRTLSAKLQSSQSVSDNLNLSVQTTMREIKFGSEFYCDTTLPTRVLMTRKSCGYTSNGGKVLILKPGDAASSTDRIAFYVKNGVLYKDDYRQGATSTDSMTSNDITIQSITFFVEGAQTYDGTSDVGGLLDYRQPLVTMLISGVPVDRMANTGLPAFNIQSTVSVREIDTK